MNEGDGEENQPREGVGELVREEASEEVSRRVDESSISEQARTLPVRAPRTLSRRVGA
jgi:hypothetical protein